MGQGQAEVRSGDVLSGHGLVCGMIFFEGFNVGCISNTRLPTDRRNPECECECECECGYEYEYECECECECTGQSECEGKGKGECRDEDHLSVCLREGSGQKHTVCARVGARDISMTWESGEKVNETRDK